MTEQSIKQYLTTDWAGGYLICKKSTGSTNDDARELAANGALHGTLVVTDDQRSGRGRNARSWVCAPGENIAMSLLLRPRLPVAVAPLLTLVMGLSVAEAIERVLCDEKQEAKAQALPSWTRSRRVGIKWPNDAVINDRKVCGILTESALTSDNQLRYCILGVGINVLQTAFPKELLEIAGSILTQTGLVVSRSRLIGEIMHRFEINYAALEETHDLRLLRASYEMRLINKDREVRVLDPAGEYTGMAGGITDTGALLVETREHGLRRINAGEVSVRGLYHYAD